MAATERVVVLMEPSQKLRLTKQARAAGLSVGEYIRNRALDEDEILKALIAELKASTAKAITAIDETLARMDAREKARAEREAEIRAEVEAQLAGIDMDAVARLFAPLRNQPTVRAKLQEAAG